MSEEPRNKNLKQTDLLSPKKEINTDSENEESSHAGITNQKRTDDSREKEAEVDPSKHDPPQNAKREMHTFNFQFKKNTHALTCNTSMTVIEALNTSNIFKNILKKYTDKELIIQRSQEKVPRAAVKRDFPCCLIDRDEVLKIMFINNDGNTSSEQKPTSDVLEPDNLVTFYIRTTGGPKIRLLMKNKNVRLNVDDVCVYAFKEERIISALERDGRFINDMYTCCALSEMDSETIYEMANVVDEIHQKHFQAIVISDFYLTDSQVGLGTFKTESGAVASTTTLVKTANQSPQVLSTETEKTPSSPGHSMKIPNSKETLEFLRAQFKDLLETLKQRKNLKNNSEVKKFFRAEYDKSVQSFLEVKKVKQLTGLSASVCQIRVEGSAKGTGFLLFDRFILTNAHVIGEFDPFSRKLSKTFTAVFGYEDLEAKETKSVSIKPDVAAFFHGSISRFRHLDFALLELDDTDEVADCPRLLNCYIHGPPPNRGGICIVGHPDGGIKKMDPCFIIEKENIQEAANEHVLKNIEFIQVITQQSLAEKWQIHENQISYDSCFFHGSSGSPVFDEDCYLIGMHTGGYVYKGENGKTRSILEYCYSMQPILESIDTQAKKNGRSDILKLLSENLDLDDNDVEMKDLQNKGQSHLSQ